MAGYLLNTDTNFFLIENFVRVSLTPNLTCICVCLLLTLRAARPNFSQITLRLLHNPFAKHPVFLICMTHPFVCIIVLSTGVRFECYITLTRLILPKHRYVLLLWTFFCLLAFKVFFFFELPLPTPKRQPLRQTTLFI